MKSKVSRQRGFTLIELLIVIAIIGLIASMLIPNMLDAMQKAKQKRTVADCKIVGTAMMAWLTDQAAAAAAGQDFDWSSYTTATIPQLTAELVPQYIQEVPQLDGWKRPFQYALDISNPLSAHVLGLRSGARDGIFEGDQYSTGAFEPTDYDRDIVWADGFFVRWPQGISN